MIKNLRYLLLSLLTIMSTAIFAQKTVTIDFDNDYQKLFPTLKGVSSGSGDNYVADGDFTEPTTSTQIDGVDVISHRPVGSDAVHVERHTTDNHIGKGNFVS